MLKNILHVPEDSRQFSASLGQFRQALHGPFHVLPVDFIPRQYDIPQENLDNALSGPVSFGSCFPGAGKINLFSLDIICCQPHATPFLFLGLHFLPAGLAHGCGPFHYFFQCAFYLCHKLTPFSQTVPVRILHLSFHLEPDEFIRHILKRDKRTPRNFFVIFRSYPAIATGNFFPEILLLPMIRTGPFLLRTVFEKRFFCCTVAGCTRCLSFVLFTRIPVTMLKLFIPEEKYMIPVIVLATRNQGKVREFQQLLKDFPVEIKNLNDFGPIPEVEEDGATFDDNAYKKAAFTARILGLPAIADDSGLVVNALDGAPGVKSARYAGDNATDEENMAKLLKELENKSDRSAAFECVISIAVPAGPALTYEGRCEGEITEQPRGESGFGYDPVFYYPEYDRTFAEISGEAKNRVSHRGKALREMVAEFDKVITWLKARLTEAKPPKPDHREFEHNDWSEDKMD
jgi:XTP/dITP diphosphohydrolase